MSSLASMSPSSKRHRLKRYTSSLIAVRVQAERADGRLLQDIELNFVDLGATIPEKHQRCFETPE
jgi:hypothetical protein